MRVRLGALARLEFEEARAWFDRQQPGLGKRFAAEVREAGGRICQMPRLCPVEIGDLCGDVRKCVLTHFPYTLRYILREDIVLVIAVSHQHRDPDYRIDRMGEQ
jgi:plasmid stabilization system protein ParE